MFRLKKIFLTICSLMVVFIFCGEVKANFGPELLLNSSYPTIYDQLTGDILSGSGLSEEDEFSRIVYQGNNMTLDSSITHNNTVYPGVNATLQSASDVLRVKDVGTLNGQKLVFALSSTIPLKFKVVNGISLNIEAVNQVGGRLSYPFQFWIEDEAGNPINDPETYFLFSFSSAYGGGSTIYETKSFQSNTLRPYFVTSNNKGSARSTLAGSFGTTESLLTLKEVPRSLPDGAVPFTYGFQQSNGSKVTLTQAVGVATWFKSLYILSKEDAAGIKVPYQKPTVLSTTNELTSGDNLLKAKLLVVQHVSRQSFDSQYANPLQLTIDPGNLIDQDSIDVSQITVTTSDNQDISSYLDKTKDANGNIIITIPKTILSSFGDDDFYIEGMLPIDADKSEVWEHLTSNNQYIQIKDIFAKNNENKKISDATDIFVKTPGPMGDPVLGTTVLQGTSTNDLNPEELVTNLTTYIPNDTIKILGFKSAKTFSEVKDDSVTVVIQSEITGTTTDVIVPIAVMSRGLNILESMVIIPEENKKATTKSELTYKPSYEQTVKKIDSGTTRIDNVVLTLTYSEYLNVAKEDFTVMADDDVIAFNQYTLYLDSSKKEVQFIFKNSAMVNLVNRKIVINQNSSLKTSDENIMSVYDLVNHTFSLPITAYHSFGEINSSGKITQSPISTETQLIEYEPAITAKAIGIETVEVNSQIKNAKDYILDISSPDFDFDNFDDIQFESVPDFSTAGQKNFNVLIKSDAFKTTAKIPVTVNVVEPTVKMSVEQVYKIRPTHKIYSDLEDKLLVDNSNNVYPVKKGDLIQDVVDQMIIDNQTEFSLQYDGYVTIDATDYKVLIDDEEVIPKPTTVPDEDFVIQYGYLGQQRFRLSDLDYGKIEMTGKQEESYDNPNENQILEVENTILDTGWDIIVSLPYGIINDKTGEAYLGGLYIEENNSKKYINDLPVTFFEQSSTEAKLLTDLPMDIKLYQKIGNLKGTYTGELLWTLVDAPE